MLRYAFLALMLLPFASSIVGEQCPDMAYYCVQNACKNSGGSMDPMGRCIAGDDFDEERYQERLNMCDETYAYCVENDGVVERMSCCGPVFILLSAALLALYASGTS